MSDLYNLLWSINQFRMLAEGGTWGVPRSGLLFRKEKGKLINFDRVPWSNTTEVPASHYSAYQEADYQLIKENFERAGIPVEKRLDQS